VLFFPLGFGLVADTELPDFFLLTFPVACKKTYQKHFMKLMED